MSLDDWDDVVDDQAEEVAGSDESEAEVPPDPSEFTKKERI